MYNHTIARSPTQLHSSTRSIEFAPCLCDCCVCTPSITISNTIDELVGFSQCPPQMGLRSNRCAPATNSLLHPEQDDPEIHIRGILSTLMIGIEQFTFSLYLLLHHYFILVFYLIIYHPKCRFITC